HPISRISAGKVGMCTSLLLTFFRGKVDEYAFSMEFYARKPSALPFHVHRRHQIILPAVEAPVAPLYHHDAKPAYWSNSQCAAVRRLNRPHISGDYLEHRRRAWRERRLRWMTVGGASLQLSEFIEPDGSGS